MGKSPENQLVKNHPEQFCFPSADDAKSFGGPETSSSLISHTSQEAGTQATCKHTVQTWGFNSVWVISVCFVQKSTEKASFLATFSEPGKGSFLIYEVKEHGVWRGIWLYVEDIVLSLRTNAGYCQILQPSLQLSGPFSCSSSVSSCILRLHLLCWQITFLELGLVSSFWRWWLHFVKHSYVFIVSG